MKLEHFKHVAKHFKLSSHLAYYVSYFCVDSLQATRRVAYDHEDEEYNITSDGFHVFSEYFSADLANEIIQYIKDTEILFI